jgi:dihydrofolate reductase
MSYTPNAPVVIVAGMEKSSRAIGRENQLLWHVPADLKRFKALTLGHPVIMGRKTFESIVAILGTPLPDRTNIVVTRSSDYTHDAENVVIVDSLEAALKRADQESPEEIHIGGGAQLYEQALPYTTRLHLTLFDDPGVEADTFFPDFTEQFTIAKIYPETEHEGLSYQWVDFKRVEDIED